MPTFICTILIFLCLKIAVNIYFLGRGKFPVTVQYEGPQLAIQLLILAGMAIWAGVLFFRP